MLNRLADNAQHIVISVKLTDFRKQIDGLVAIVSTQFRLDPYSDKYIFIFCNKRKNTIRVLRYDKNGFILATKKLLDKMKFQWPSTADDVKAIDSKQLQWLLDGLEIEQKKAHHKVDLTLKNTCY